jgi:CRP/FNR family transcriptional regulator, cyclic AMP receptor protein
MMPPSEMAKVIRNVLCRGLSFEQTEHILRVMLPAKFEAGTALYKEGESAQGLVVLLAGTVEVMKAGAPDVLATIEGPAVFGEISLLTDGRHTATVMAKTQCQLALLTKTQFERLVREESVAAFKLLHTLAEVLAHRLNKMDDKFIELKKQGNGGNGKQVEELSAFKQKLFTDWKF